MTKAKAFAVARELNCRCDEAYALVIKIGAGVLCDVDVKGSDSWTLLSLFINLLERTMTNLKRQHQDEFRQMLIANLQRYLTDEKPPPVAEKLSGKQLKKRISRNQKIIAEIEELLKSQSPFDIHYPPYQS